MNMTTNMELRRTLRRGKGAIIPNRHDQVYTDNLAIREAMKAETKNKGKQVRKVSTKPQQPSNSATFAVRKVTRTERQPQLPFPSVVRVPQTVQSPTINNIPIRKPNKITDIVKRLNRRVLG